MDHLTPEGDVEVRTERAVRCAQCGGLNPAHARWCGQCLARFDGPSTGDAAPSAPPPPPAPAAPSTEANEAPGDAPAVDLPDGEPVRRGAFEVSNEGIFWSCRMCETQNPLESTHCSVCGTPFAQTVLPEEAPVQRDPNMAAMLSLFLPGAGHAYVGLWGQAVARAVVSLWVIMVVFVAAIQKGAGGANLIMVGFGLVAIGLWAVAAHDAYREARREAALVILKGRMFFYLVLGLLMLLVILMIAIFVKAQGAN